MHVREQIKRELSEVILAECKRLNIQPTDSAKVMMHAHEIWQALVRSGKMPRILTYDAMIDGMTTAAMRSQFNTVFGGNYR